MKNFELTSESKVTEDGVTLYRIKSTVTTPNRTKGQLGGWVEKENNLAGSAWIYGDAQVYGNAQVYGDAQVYDGARVSGTARVSEKISQ